jgi:hypothetical protein
MYCSSADGTTGLAAADVNEWAGEGVTIQQLKQLYRQEIANPASWWVGTIVGAIVGFIIGGAKIREAQITPPISDSFVQSFFVILGVFFGVSIGWMVRQLNEIRYDWRYLTLKKELPLLL